MEMTAAMIKRAELLTVILGIFLGTAIVLLIVDYQIKTVIIQESERMREALRAAGNERPDNLRNNSNSDWYSNVPWSLVPDRDARMETQGMVYASEKLPGQGKERYVYPGDTEIPGTDGSVGTRNDEEKE